MDGFLEKIIAAWSCLFFVGLLTRRHIISDFWPEVLAAWQSVQSAFDLNPALVPFSDPSTAASVSWDKHLKRQEGWQGAISDSVE